MSNSVEDVYKTFLKSCFKGDKKKIFIEIRSIRKNLLDIKIKDEGKSGNQIIRVHTSDEKAPPWYVNGIAIPIENLGLEKIKKKNKKILNLLNEQTDIPDVETKSLLRKLIKDYGYISSDGTRNSYGFKTEHFKKQKDYFKVKMKSF